MKTAAIILILTIIGQSSAPKPAFDVVSIKANLVGRNDSVAQQPGGRFVATAITIRHLLQLAYRGNQRFVGGPSWVDTDHWDIQAKAPDGVALPRVGLLDMTAPDTMALMVQSLLEDRFKLKSHTETRELPLYELVVAKGGAKIKPSEDQTPAPALFGGGGGRGGTLQQGSVRIGGANLEVKGQPISLLAVALGTVFLDRPVIDKTGLAGLYDVKLQWDPDPGLSTNAGPNGIPSAPAAALGPSLSIAIEEQLGLHLQASKGPLPVLVIDSVEKPADN